tara:strand:- start:45 stop:371 length:327 start_codon:yes stop_codon:yes gene_type:complete
MPFRGHGPQETPAPLPVPPPGQNPFGPQPQIVTPPRWDEDREIELDQELHRDAERIAAMQQYNSPIMSNEREQRRLARQARKAAPKPGKFNLVLPGKNVFPGPPGPAQ